MVLVMSLRRESFDAVFLMTVAVERTVRPSKGDNPVENTVIITLCFLGALCAADLLANGAAGTLSLVEFVHAFIR